MTKVLVLGATGLVGSQVVDLTLNDNRITKIIAPTRRALMTRSPRLLNPVVDLGSELPDAEWWVVDAVICAIGTTRKTAGSDEAFRHVDFDIPYAVAAKVRETGVGCFVLTSSIGANPTSRFLYPRTKGELEVALGGLNFPSLTILRPNVLGGKRREFRSGERVALAVLGAVGRVLPRRYRISPAQVVARELIEAAVTAPAGKHVMEADRLSE